MEESQDRDSAHQEEHEKVVEWEAQLVSQRPGPQDTSQCRSKSAHERGRSLSDAVDSAQEMWRGRVCDLFGQHAKEETEGIRLRSVFTKTKMK